MCDRIQYGFVSWAMNRSNVKGQDWYQADAVAEEYDDVRFSGGGVLIDRREKEAVLSALGPIKEGHRVLEVACGTGRFTTMLADQGADIVGLDISREMLEQGREKTAAAGLSDTVEFMRGTPRGSRSRTITSIRSSRCGFSTSWTTPNRSCRNFGV